MSNRALTWAFDQELKSGPKFVLVALADWADDEGSCFPGIKTIAKRVGSVESAAKENLAKLKRAGLVVEERRTRPNGARTSNRYWLQMRGRANLEPESENLEPESGGESEPPVVNHQKRTPSTPPTPPSDGFDEAWDAWPRKVGKKAAGKAWPIAVRSRGSRDDLIADVARFGAAYARYPKSRHEFIPHLSSWLNGERWTDPIPALVSAVQSGLDLLAELEAEAAELRMIEENIRSWT